MATESTERAFVDLYEATYPFVLAFLRRRVDEENARDLAAATFLTAWRRREDALDGGLPWLYVTARLTMQNMIRSEERRRMLEAKIASTLRLNGGADPVGTTADSGALIEALATLSETDRDLLLLTVWEGLQVNEAARVVNLSAAAASKRLQRARARLARSITPLEPVAERTSKRGTAQ